MRIGLFKLLVCPNCWDGSLGLEIEEQREEDVVEGKIICERCGQVYPVRGGIPCFVQDVLGVKETETKETEMNEIVLKANIEYHDFAPDLYEKDSSTREVFGETCQARIQELVQLMRQKTDGNLFVDVGCGTGNILRYAKNDFKEAVGIDVSSGMLRIAKSRGLEVMEANGNQTPFPSESIDAVSCFSVVHHLYDSSPLFQEIFRILKKGGMLYTDWDPNRKSREIERSKIYSLIYSLALRVLHRGPRLQHSEMKKIAELAEYHHYLTDGLDAHDIKAKLLQIGFTDVNIVFHSNCKSIYHPKEMPLTSRMEFWLKSLLTFFKYEYKDLAKVFAILAQK